MQGLRLVAWQGGLAGDGALMDPSQAEAAAEAAQAGLDGLLSESQEQLPGLQAEVHPPSPRAKW